jgi:phage-related protein
VGSPEQFAKPKDRPLLFFADEGRLGVVHGFIKKTQKTPPDDLALARKRMKEMKE